MYPVALASLRAEGVDADELSEWLGVLAPRVAGDWASQDAMIGLVKRSTSLLIVSVRTPLL